MDYNLNFDIRNADGTSFYGLSLRNAVYESTVMSLSDKISGNVYYKDASLPVTMHEYVEYNGVKFVLVNPPVMVKEGMVSDNSELKGTTKYSFTFYHPMYMLANIPFTDIAVTTGEEKYLSQNKTFSWVGNLQDYVAKLNANLQYTEWFVEISDSLYDGGQPSEKITQIGDVLSFSDNSIADALKTGYDTYGTAFIIDKICADEAQPQGSAVLKKFKIVFGNPSNEIYETDEHGEKTTTPFVFRYGRGVGLKNNSRTPKNNKIITRIAGQGSETNIPYGYPQIVWYGNQDWDYTIDNDASNPNSYPIYKGIVGGAYVKLIKHPFTRTRIMPSVYAQDVFNKVSPYLSDGSENTAYNPQGEIKDYYDAIPTEEYPYKNSINPLSPSYEIHTFEEVKPELGDARIEKATPLDDNLQPIESWDYTMDDNGGYHPSYFRIKLPQLDFDIYACASITETMQINMRGGACIGCTFEVQVDWEDYKRNFYDENGEFAPYGTQRDYTKYPDSRSNEIEVIVSKDLDTFGTLMPNIYQYPKGNDVLGEGNGDLFVILGISLPLSYIENAQERLDSEMKAFMLENNDYYYEYPLKFDEAFLAKNQGILAQIVPNTIVRFNFSGSGEESLYVQQMSINYGVAPLPQYAITLTDHIEVVLNKIGQLESDLDKLGIVLDSLRQNGLTAAQLRSLIDTYGSTRFLSKVNDDTAQGIITFLKGLLVGQNPTDSLLDGSGTIIDDGRVQATDVEVRGTLKVLDLVASQIHALDGYYYFSDTMKIARVENLDLEDNTARLVFEKDYENDFLKFYVGDYLLSVRADLEDTTTPRETSESGNTIRDIATQSWMRVTDTSDGMGDELWCDVQILAPNNVPQAGAYVARRGNANEESGRTSSWCISVEEGRITYYINQTDNVTHDYNYGVVVGKLPDIAPVRSAKAVGEVGVYAKYLLAQNLVTVRWAGNVRYVTEDKEEWNATDAANGEYYYSSQYDATSGVTTIARTKVTHNGCTWICVGNDEGRAYTTKEPTIQNSAQWALLSGGDVVTSEETYYATTATDDIDDSDSIDDEVDGGGVSLGDNNVTWYANQKDCEYDALFPYMWKKTIIKTIANPSGTETIELIGVYGETGLNCHVTLDMENVFIDVNSNGTPIEETGIDVGVHLWLDTEELPISEVEVLSDIPTGLEVAVERSGSEGHYTWVLAVSVLEEAQFDISSPYEVEVRVTGEDTRNGLTQTYTRLFTMKLVGVRAGKDGTNGTNGINGTDGSNGTDGEDALNIELSMQDIFIPVDDGVIQESGNVRIDYRTIKGSVVQVVPNIAYVTNAEIIYHGTNSDYLSVTYGAAGDQWVRVSYENDSPFEGQDWAEVRLTFNNNMIRTIKAYPNVNGMDAIGKDALNVKLSQDTYRIPIYDPRTKNVDTREWNPIITREYADLVADVSAMRGTSQVMVTLSNASIMYYKNGVAYSPQTAYLTATIINAGQSVKVHVNPNVNVEKGNNDTISAKVNITYNLGGVTYSGLSIAVFTELSVAQVWYEKFVEEDFVVGMLGGSKTISPNVLSLVYKRHADDTTQTLDSDSMRRLYMDESNTNQIEIPTWNGSSVVTNTISLIGLGATFGMTTYAVSIESPVVVTYSPIDAEPIVNQLNVTKNGADGSRGFPGCITRLHENVLKAGTMYRNDSFATDAGENENGMFYVDYVAVLAQEMPSGYDVYVVSTNSPLITITGEDDIDLTTKDDLLSYMQGLGFERVASNMPSAWFTTLFAKNAQIQMLSGAAITMLNSQQQITAGIANGEGAQGEAITGYHFWSGAADPANANFSVNKDGKLKATGAEIEGSITAKEGKIADFTIDDDGLYYGDQTEWGSETKRMSAITTGVARFQSGNSYDGHAIDVGKVSLGIESDPQESSAVGYIYRNRLAATDDFVAALRVVDIQGANSKNIAIAAEQGLILGRQGMLAFAHYMDITNIGSANAINTIYGSDFIVKNTSGAARNLYLPNPQIILAMCGLVSTNRFAYKLRIVCDLNNNATIYLGLYPNSSTDGRAYFLNGKGIDMSTNGYLLLGKGNSVELMHVYDGTYNYSYVLSINN